jgi:hypothetical protein
VPDLPETGAQFCDAPALAPGEYGTISLDRVAMPLSFVVRGADHRGSLHVEFDENGAARLAASELPDRLQQLGVV